jgi:hypothetical protein
LNEVADADADADVELSARHVVARRGHPFLSRDELPERPGGSPVQR